MSASNKTWSWTVIVQTPGIYRDVPDFCDLRCSPQGQLLMVEKLVGKFFSIWAEDAPGMSPEPTPHQLEQARSLIQVQLNPNHLQHAHSMNHVQRAKKHYTAAYTLPDGEPQVPPTLASTHCAFQESD